jgi:hypothetical protein
MFKLLLPDIILLMLGLAVILFHKRMAGYAVERRRKALGVEQPGYYKQGFRIGYLIMGIVLTILGIIALLGNNNSS